MPAHNISIYATCTLSEKRAIFHNHKFLPQKTGTRNQFQREHSLKEGMHVLNSTHQQMTICRKFHSVCVNKQQ